jgi:hypothetical protein
MPNRTSAEMEEQILLNTRAYPMLSYVRLAQEMQSKGIAVSPTMVRYVWRRHSLSTRAGRLEWNKSLEDGTSTSMDVQDSLSKSKALIQQAEGLERKSVTAS